MYQQLPAAVAVSICKLFEKGMSEAVLDEFPSDFPSEFPSTYSLGTTHNLVGARTLGKVQLFFFRLRFAPLLLIFPFRPNFDGEL